MHKNEWNNLLFSILMLFITWKKYSKFHFKTKVIWCLININTNLFFSKFIEFENNVLRHMTCEIMMTYETDILNWNLLSLVTFQNAKNFSVTLSEECITCRAHLRLWGRGALLSIRWNFLWIIINSLKFEPVYHSNSIFWWCGLCPKVLVINLLLSISLY